MLRTISHGRDTFRVPIGDVLIKCCSLLEHSTHGRDTFRVPIGDVLIKCCIIEHCENERVGKEFVSIQQFIFC